MYTHGILNSVCVLGVAVKRLVLIALPCFGEKPEGGLIPGITISPPKYILMHAGRWFLSLSGPSRVQKKLEMRYS